MSKPADKKSESIADQHDPAEADAVSLPAADDVDPTGASRMGRQAAAEPEQQEPAREVATGDADEQDDEAVVRQLTPEVTVESIIEALLFATDAPLSATRLAQIIGVGTASEMKRYVKDLNEGYEANDCAFRIITISGGFQMYTLPEFEPWIAKLSKSRADSRLSQAALETLAIVAYKQPIMRADVEAIRGVAVGDMLVRLREMKLVKIVGRAEEVGRPLLYGTTPRFLEVFGLASLKDLPKLEEDPAGGAPKLKLAKPEAETPAEEPPPAEAE